MLDTWNEWQQFTPEQRILHTLFVLEFTPVVGRSSLLAVCVPAVTLLLHALACLNWVLLFVTQL